MIEGEGMFFLFPLSLNPSCDADLSQAAPMWGCFQQGNLRRIFECMGSKMFKQRINGNVWGRKMNYLSSLQLPYLMREISLPCRNEIFSLIS